MASSTGTIPATSATTSPTEGSAGPSSSGCSPPSTWVTTSPHLADLGARLRRVGHGPLRLSPDESAPSRRQCRPGLSDRRSTPGGGSARSLRRVARSADRRHGGGPPVLLAPAACRIRGVGDRAARCTLRVLLPA